MSFMIKVDELYHSYSNDEKYAIKNISFEVVKGEVFGFLGPSGAGKSTTQGILTGLLSLQKGNVTVAGYDVKHLKSKLFDVPTRDPIELIKMVGLEGKENVRTGEFSKGMKHRLTFARSILNNPELWFLDEPTTGLDPAIAATIKDIIKTHNE